MRKKSHISLARYIAQDMQVPAMIHHRKAFYLGSILPDCKPSFLTRRHEFHGTFDMVKERICVLSADSGLLLDNGRVFMRRLGEIIHYIADYFTYDAKRFETAEAVCSFIQRAHEDYLQMKHGVQEDCEYIVRICHQVVQAILNLVNLAAAKEVERRFCPA